MAEVAPPRRQPRSLTQEEFLMQQIEDLRMLLMVKDSACRHIQEQSDQLQEQLEIAQARAVAAEATTAQLMEEKQVDATRMASLEQQLEHAQQEQRNLHGYTQKMHMLVQELQRAPHTVKRMQSGGLTELLEPTTAPLQTAPQRLALAVANSTSGPVAEAPETPDTERESMQVADVSMTDTETTKQPTTERSWWFGNSSGKERRTPHVAMPT